MKRLKEMIESARLYGVHSPLHEKPAVASAATDNFFSVVEECQSFVFESFCMAEKSLADHVPPDSVPSAPFKVFSIEVRNGFVCRIKDSSPVDERLSKVVCLLAVEALPGVTGAFVALAEDGCRTVVLYLGHLLNDVIESYVAKLKASEIGLEQVRERIKIGAGASKRIHTIRRIIRVARKGRSEGVPSLGGGRIDWSHRWLVRGHWRRHPGLGKDRNGDYCIDGFTWVVDHEKGPDDAPLVGGKVRLVSSPPPPTEPPTDERSP